MIAFKTLENGFEYIDVSNEVAHAKIALQGAHLFHFASNNEKPLLWLSDTSDFEVGKAIRGGIPICWPSFGASNPDLPQHGFARTALWTLESSREIDNHTTQLTLVLHDTKESLKLWNYKFKVALRITLSYDVSLELETTNLDEKPLTLTQALHTYFTIDNIFDVTIHGLDNKPYFNSLTNTYEVNIGDIVFDKEYDAIYQEVDKPITLLTKNREITITNTGSSSVVVWNPWIDKCKRISGMRDEAYLEFVCIESANANADFKLIEPHKTHLLKTCIGTKSLFLV